MVPPVLRDSSERLASDRAPSLPTADRASVRPQDVPGVQGTGPLKEVDGPEHERCDRTFPIVAFESETEAWGPALQSMLLTVGFVVPWPAGVSVLRGNTPPWIGFRARLTEELGE